METLQMNPQNFVSKARFMNSIASKLRPKLLYATSSQLKALCTTTTTTTTTSSSSLTLNSTAISSVNELIHEPVKKSAVKNTSSVKVRVKVKNKASITAQFKDNWLASISCPFPEDKSEESAVINGGDTIPSPRGDAEDKIVIGIDPDLSGALAVLKTDAQGCTTAESVKGLDGDVVKDMDKSEESTVINGGDTIPSPRGNAEDKIVIGIDPDLSGALAVLKTDAQGCTTAEVFDSPLVKLMVGKSVRRRLDTNSIVKLLQSFDAPVGTIAYLEQSIPFPQDGKQGWWSGGFGYGLWIGVLVASGFSVVPVPSYTWKSEFELAGKQISKDDSRELASTLFPSMSSLFKRKKDHGRAEALLIAAYGKGMKIKSKPVYIADELVPTLTCSTISPHF